MITPEPQSQDKLCVIFVCDQLIVDVLITKFLPSLDYFWLCWFFKGALPDSSIFCNGIDVLIYDRRKAHDPIVEQKFNLLTRFHINVIKHLHVELFLALICVVESSDYALTLACEYRFYLRSEIQFKFPAICSFYLLNNLFTSVLNFWRLR